MEPIKNFIIIEIPSPHGLVEHGNISNYLIENLWDEVEKAMDLHDVSFVGDESLFSWISEVK